MVELLPNYRHQLRFCIDKDAPKKYIAIFEELKAQIENNDNNGKVSEEIRENSKLESNKNLPILQRMEGGLGGNSNLKNKQLRYRAFPNSDLRNSDAIIINVFHSDDGIEKWTYVELDDIVLSCLKVLNSYMGTECIHGSIELVRLVDEFCDDDDDDE